MAQPFQYLNRALHLKTIRDPKTDWGLLGEFARAEGGPFREAEDQVSQYVAEITYRIIKRTMDAGDYPGASHVSPATIAILQARQFTKAGSRTLHYPKTGYMTRIPLRRNDQLYNAIKIYRSGKVHEPGTHYAIGDTAKTSRTWAVGIHASARSVNGVPLAQIAKWMTKPEGETIRVSADMQAFFRALRRISTEKLQRRTQSGILRSARKLTKLRSRLLSPFRGVGVERRLEIPHLAIGDYIHIPQRDFMAQAVRFLSGSNPGALAATRRKAETIYRERVEKAIRRRRRGGKK